MADFKTAYTKYVKPWEGGYSYAIKGDSGGETYAGIARNYNPMWKGWAYIDDKKKQMKDIPHNTIFPDIDFLVVDYYNQMWNRGNFGQIKSQPVADLLFDYRVNSGTGGIVNGKLKEGAVTAVQKLVGLIQDGVMGPVTISKINATDSAKLHDALKAQRMEHVIRYTNTGDTEKFRDGLVARIASFPTLTKSLSAVFIFAVGVGLYLILSK